MRKRRPSRSSHNRPVARATTSLGSKRAAFWAMRAALGDIPSDFISHDAKSFIRFIAPYICWTPAAFEHFLLNYNSAEIDSTSLQELPPQAESPRNLYPSGGLVFVLFQRTSRVGYRDDASLH